MKPGTSEIIEPTRYIRVVLTKKMPLFLVNAMHRTFFGWCLDSFNWEPIHNKRYFVRMVITRKNPRAVWYNKVTEQRISLRVYNRIKFVSLLRLCFLLLRSSKGKVE